MNNQYEKLRKLAAVSHLNFMFGAGTSRDFLPLLNNIEEEMNKAEKAGTAGLKQLYIERQRYFSEVMLPNLEVLGSIPEDESDLAKTYVSYRSFFKVVTEYLLSRKSTLLDKQVNTFTTNIDIFMEKALEDMNINFNDGFSGRIDPILDTSNFLTVLKKKSEHFSKQSEIPTFNIYKLHGSLNWRQAPVSSGEDEIRYSNLAELTTLNDNIKKQAAFNKLYEKLQIVNPSNSKFGTTLIEYVYYEMLRLYSTALENEQSILFVVGFSFADKHILKMTKRALNSNPTLSICIFSHSSENVSHYQAMFSDTRYSNNVYIIGPDEGESINLNYVTTKALAGIFKDVNEESSD